MPPAGRRNGGWRLATSSCSRFASTLALAGWAAVYGPTNEGLAYLAATVPAGLVSLANLSPGIMASGRRLPAFLVQQMPWPAALLIWWLVAGANGAAWEAGLIVSAGFLAQALIGLVFWPRPALLVPLFGAGGAMLGAAARLSVMGIAGALHDRLTPFLLARLAPDFLPCCCFSVMA